MTHTDVSGLGSVPFELTPEPISFKLSSKKTLGLNDPSALLISADVTLGKSRHIPLIEAVPGGTYRAYRP
jgi:hypothetical protein